LLSIEQPRLVAHEMLMRYQTGLLQSQQEGDTMTKPKKKSSVVRVTDKEGNPHFVTTETIEEWHARSLEHQECVLGLLRIARDLEERAEQVRLTIENLNYNFKHTFKDHVGFEP
jgi:hypothetical protein